MPHPPPPLIGLYCPDLPPVPGGVSDHTLALARALDARGTRCAVFGARGDPARFAPVPVALGVTPSRLVEAVTAAGVTALLVQYVPFLYQRFGVAPALCPALRALAARGVRVGLFVHEPYVPFTRLPWLVTGVLQRLQLGCLVRAVDRVYAAVPAFAAMARRAGRATTPVTVAPVGSTLPVSTATRADARAALGLPHDVVAIGVFSPAASGYRTDWVRAAMTALAARRDVQWLVFGNGSDRWLPDALPNVRCLGRVGAGAAADIARALDLFVAPYVDGLTMRRSGAMLGLAHGLPVVSSTGPLFDASLAATVRCEPDAAAFVHGVCALADDPAARRELAGRGAAGARVASIDTLAALLAADFAG